MEKQLLVGWATTSITPERPAFLIGQLYYRVSRYVHDPITATALVLTNGDDEVIFLSADMESISADICEAVRKNLDSWNSIKANKICFSATHSHTSTYVRDERRAGIIALVGEDTLPPMDIPKNVLNDDEAEEIIIQKFTGLIKEAWEARAPGGISGISDYAAISFNRRPQFDHGDGKIKSKMYGDCSQDNFLRFEGTVDHAIDMLYTWDNNRNLTGVLVDVPCPAQVFELHSFISADYWANARNAIRKRLGNVYILSLCGSAGDQNPIDLVKVSKQNANELKEWRDQAQEVNRNFDMSEECNDIGARIADAVYRGFCKARNTVEKQPVLYHSIMDISLPIRTVSEEAYLQAKEEIKKIVSQFPAGHRMEGKDLVRLFEPMGVIGRREFQQKGDHTIIRSDIIRIGNTIICTTPFEVFVEYALQIRARSKAPHVFTIQLTNGASGYLSTEIALNGGSYSSKPASTLVGPKGGKLLTEILIKEINRLWINKDI